MDGITDNFPQSCVLEFELKICRDLTPYANLTVYLSSLLIYLSLSPTSHKASLFSTSDSSLSPKLIIDICIIFLFTSTRPNHSLFKSDTRN